MDKRPSSTSVTSWLNSRTRRRKWVNNPLRPNNDESQTSHCNIKGVSVSEVMRIKNMITQVKFY